MMFGTWWRGSTLAAGAMVIAGIAWGACAGSPDDPGPPSAPEVEAPDSTQASPSQPSDADLEDVIQKSLAMARRMIEEVDYPEARKKRLMAHFRKRILETAGMSLRERLEDVHRRSLEVMKRRGATDEQIRKLGEMNRDAVALFGNAEELQKQH